MAAQIAEFTTESKYKLSFVQKQRQLKLSDSVTEIRRDQPLLCLKGADAVKTYTRFATIDSPERPVTYLSDDVGLDAVSFVPQRDITFLGFSVYAVISS